MNGNEEPTWDGLKRTLFTAAILAVSSLSIVIVTKLTEIISGWNVSPL